MVGFTQQGESLNVGNRASEMSPMTFRSPSLGKLIWGGASEAEWLQWEGRRTSCVWSISCGGAGGRGLRFAAVSGWGGAWGRCSGLRRVRERQAELERIAEGQQGQRRLLEVRGSGKARGSGVMEIQEWWMFVQGFYLRWKGGCDTFPNGISHYPRKVPFQYQWT